MTQFSPETFIVILGVREWPLAHLVRCLSSIRMMGEPGLEVRVVDLGPLDAHRFLTLDLGPRVHILSCPRSEWSRSVALNLGARRLRPEVEWLVFTDADMIFPRSWFSYVQENLIPVWEGHPPGIFLTPSRDLPEGWEEVGESTLPGGAVISNWLSEEWLLKMTTPHPDIGQGAAMIVPRFWFQAVRGFDERYRIWGCEDNDLVMRAEWCELPIVTLHATFVAHQWHPRSHPVGGPVWQAVRDNRAYFAERIVQKGSVLRNPQQWGGVWDGARLEAS